MGGFAMAVAFPVDAFWLLNQPALFKVFMRGYRVPDSREADEEIARFKEQLLDEYESFLRQQMAFEEARHEMRGASRKRI
ncbi:unnamed protein product [Heligmosomoides polygyrus]|uniref:DUF2852 domain-containing protein n=1 Tax=Heligmosomoides polygyrus TaxID=6339 RepID=A0A183FET3_HELPZ|nr:unnamed protein product [Heligmosomoides polygyrus]